MAREVPRFDGRNRVAVGGAGGTFTQGSSQGSQSWALGRNPVGILKGMAEYSQGELYYLLKVQAVGFAKKQG